MSSILTVIDVIERQFPRNLPSTATCLAIATRKRNSFVAIHKLPTEIMVELIRLAASDRELERPSGILIDPYLLRNLSQLRLVCNFWKNTIDEERSLWAFLAADTRSLRPLNAAIAKSQGVPVVITSGKNQMDEEAFAITVSPLIHSCRVLCLESRLGGYLEDRGVYHLVQQPSPILEELYFARSFDSSGWNYRRSPEGRQKPRRRTTNIWSLENNPEKLKVLRLREVNWCWAGLVLSNLRDLKLSSVTISASELVECISRTPRLESLHATQLIEDWTVDATVVQLVPPPSFRRIRMFFVSTAFIHSTLSNIDLLSLEHVHLLIYPVPFNEDTLFQMRPYSLPMQQRPGLAALCMGPDFLKLQTLSRDEDREATLTGEDLTTPTQREEFARWLSNLWASVEPKPSLLIALGRWGCSSSPVVPLHTGLVSAFLTFDHVLELHIGFQVGDVHLLYDSLSHPVLSGNGKLTWGLPKLEVLLVEGQPHSGELLIQMLEARYTAIANGHSGDKQNQEELTATILPPSRLQKVRIIHRVYKMPSWMIIQDEALKRIVGEEHFDVEIVEPF
ncbi:hypothetical protein FS837_011199 [Tulasnella sp. UAMH 9824]|nr:hypothetical protein FS837_011199 [Tulasnella sp. UAMH 9824]